MLYPGQPQPQPGPQKPPQPPPQPQPNPQHPQPPRQPQPPQPPCHPPPQPPPCQPKPLLIPFPWKPPPKLFPWNPTELLANEWPPAKLDEEPCTFSAPPRCGALIEPAEPKWALVRVVLLKCDVEERPPAEADLDVAELLK